MVIDQRKAGADEKPDAPPPQAPTQKLSIPTSVWAVFIVLLIADGGLFFGLGLIWRRPTAETPGAIPEPKYYELGLVSAELQAGQNITRVFSLKVTLGLSKKNDPEETRKILDVMKPVIRDKVLTLLRGMTFDKAHTLETLAELRRKIQAIVDEEVGVQRVESVLFVE